MKLKRLLAIIVLMGLALPCWATRPLSDRLDYEGEETNVFSKDKPWLDLLENEKTQEIRLRERCSAIGAPRANWRIVDNKLWLIGLFSCRGAIKLETVYGGNGEPMLAGWITAEIHTQRGRYLCRGFGAGESTVLETTLVFSIEHGLVKNTLQFSNLEHPSVPTLEDLQKIFGPFKDYNDLKKNMGEPDQWPCIDPQMLSKTRGTPIPVSSPKGTTFGEYLNEDVKKKLGQ